MGRKALSNRGRNRMRNREKRLKILNLITKRKRFELVKALYDANKPMSHSEIKKLLELKGIRGYSNGNLWTDLKLLTNYGVIRYMRQMKVNPETGRTTVSLFWLTAMGKQLLSKIEDILKNGLGSSPFLLAKLK